MSVKLSISGIKWNRKPVKGEIAVVSNSFTTATMSIEELATKVVAPNSQTWIPAVFKNSKRNNESWQSQQIIALDIDHDLTFNDFMERAKKYGIMPTLVYSTFSHSEAEHKYRAIYVLPVEVSDIDVRNVLQRFLMRLYPETDKATADLARMYFGGKELLYTDYDHTLDIQALIDSTVRYIYDTDKNNNATREVATLCKSVGLDTINGFPAVVSSEFDESMKNDDLSTSTIRVLMVVAAETSKIITFQFSADSQYNKAKNTYSGKIHNHKLPERELIRNADMNAVREQDEMFRGFENGSLWLYEPELWGMLTNLLWIEGGEKLFLQGIARREEYDLGFWKYQIMMAKKKQYAPMRYENYYPSNLRAPEATNMLQIAKKERGKIEMIKSHDKITLKEAEVALHIAFTAAMESSENGVYVVKAPTGIGKTVEYEGVKNATIALPTHALKQEVYERMLSVGNDALLSPEMPEDMPEEIKKAVENLYRIGAIPAANRLLRKEAQNDPIVAEYVAQKDATARVNGTNLLTTHSRLFHLAATNDTIIVDEDIIPAMYPQNHAALKDVLYMEEVSKPKGFGAKSRKDWPMNSIVQFIRDALPFIVYPMPNYRLTSAELKEIEAAVINKKLSSNVIGLLSATHIYKTDADTVYYIQRKELPKNKKIIILSATANEEMYKLVFGDLLKSFTDIGKVESVGKIHQMIGINTSRTALTENPENIDKVMKVIVDTLGENPTVITYKAFEAMFNAVAHFGGLVGIDKYKGMSMAIVGTPHYNEVVYLLLASALGIKITPEFDDYQAYGQITRNGYRYDFMTYTRNPLLREVQLYLIESELEQAIGRARALRNDVIVLVFSNLPISGAKIIYLQDEDSSIKPKKIRTLATSNQAVAYA